LLYECEAAKNRRKIARDERRRPSDFQDATTSALLLPEKKMLTIVKNKAGKYRWVAVSSTAHRDEDNEIVSRAALKKAVERAKSRRDFGPLRFWHEAGLDLGSTDFMELTDDGKYLVESGLIYDNDIALKIKNALQSSEWQMSIGFRHPRTEPDHERVYHNIDIFERSIVPYGKAANRLTSFNMKGR